MIIIEDKQAIGRKYLKELPLNNLLRSFNENWIGFIQN
jgi:hypothetical protein